ncbi:wd40 repeat-like protein [Fusarium flagelliforme]|uniref:Wd40 repeat-like protein n=1 Tax=Fusarium flagelliforme TaxID=2675880 RepID=A0A395MI99_9HYPO|nr:wd40 repeat-like protein [Fusarium flagelliforme]
MGGLVTQTPLTFHSLRGLIRHGVSARSQAGVFSPTFPRRFLVAYTFHESPKSDQDQKARLEHWQRSPMPDRTLKDKFRRLKVRVQEGFKDPRAGSDGLDPSLNDSGQPSGQTIPGSQQVATGNVQRRDQTEVAAASDSAASSHPLSTTNENDTPPLEVNAVDASGWGNIWAEAHKKVKEDPKDATLLAKLELFLEKGGDTAGIVDGDEDSAVVNSQARLKAIQKIAKEKLDVFEEGKLSFNIRDRPIVVRESIVKAVDVINSFKPIVTGAVAAEPAAALAWAGITTALPMLERIFQQDEDAATGVTEITFLMARYQMFHEPDFASDLQSMSHSAASNELLHNVREELVGIHADIYLYEARFILQYATRKKMHRAFRNALNSDDWKKLLSEIQSKARRIDDGVRGQIGGKTLEMWKKVKAIQTTTERIEFLQQDTMKAVLDVDRRQLLQSLKVTGNAIFDSRQTSNMEVPCLPGTQLQILKIIQTWAEDPTDTMILWLEGMAGTGKTSVSMTVASSLKEEKGFTYELDPPHKAFLGASFFFNQVDATRNSTVEFFTTIAWCLSAISPDNGSPIIKAIRDNPGIEMKSPQEQFRKLVADPLTWLDKNTFIPFQLLVVIDALDECDDNDAEILLGMLENLDNLTQVRLRLFITSRREEHISTSFKNLPSNLYRTVRLEKVKASLRQDDDITFYLSKTLEDISTRYRVKDGGVTGSDIKKLAEKADGLFIYAVTACRFLDGPHYRSTKYRDKRLTLIFEDKDGPQQEVDSIYLKVLTFQDLENESDEYRHGFYRDISRLIGFIVILLQPVSVRTLCHLLPADNADLEVLLGYLHPILNVPDDSQVPVTLIHLSFRDFILDEKRSELLPISIKELGMHQDIFSRCLDIMNSGLRYNICCLDLPGMFVSEVELSRIQCHIPQHLRYVCRHWVSHLSKLDPQCLVQDVLEKGGALHVFIQEKLPFWLEVMAFVGEAPAIIPIISQLERLTNLSENPDLQSLVYDAKRFIQDNRWIIENAPIQMYCSALLFCPSKSKIRLHYQHLIPEWIMKRPKTSEAHTSALCTLHGHTGSIFKTQFSPTEPLLASTSSDNTIRVWDYITGSEQYRFQNPGKPYCVAFSMDGAKLAYGCFDGTLHLSVKSGGHLVFANLYQHIGRVVHTWEPQCQGFFFSPDGRLIAVKRGFAISVFDVQMGKVVRQFEARNTPNTFAPTTLAFSIDSKTLAVRHYKSIDFWDITSSNPNLIESYQESTWLPDTFLHLPIDTEFHLDQGSFGTVELYKPSTEVSLGKFYRGFGGTWSHDGAFLVDISSGHPLIAIFNNPPNPSVRENRDTAPWKVEFLSDDGIALSWNSKLGTDRWNVMDGSMEPLQDRVDNVTFSSDGHFVLLGLAKHDKFQVWNQSLSHLHATFDEMAHVAWAPHIGHLATLSLHGEFQVLKWAVESSSFILIEGFTFEGFRQFSVLDLWSPSAFYLSPSGQEAIVNVSSWGSSGPVSCQLWDLKKKKKVHATILQAIYDISFSPTNDFFSVRYQCGQQTGLYCMSSGEEVKDCDLRGYSHPTFHPVENIIALQSEDGKTVAIWEGPTWTQKVKFEAPDGMKVRDYTFSATSKVAALYTSQDAHSSVIDIWDIAIGQRIGSHTFHLAGWAFYLSFSPDERFLQSNRGRIPLPIQDTTKELSNKHWEGIHNCLYVLDEWVFQGHQRLIWLPSAYRPETSGCMNIDVRDGMIALAIKKNSVVFIGVSLGGTPVAKTYIGLNTEKP